MELATEVSVPAAEISGLATQNGAAAEKKQPSKRFDGLDGVRATAMLLGVFYHLPISMYQGGGFGFGGFGAASSPKQSIDDWLHSFRMPLFFLISGFFANMMLRKYGWKQYLFRRWWRIAAPLFVSLFALAGFRIAMEYFQPANDSPFGMPFFGAPPGGADSGAPAFGGAPFGPPPGFGNAPQGPNQPTANGNARGGPLQPGGMPFGPFGGAPAATAANSPFGPPRGFGPPPGAATGSPAPPPAFQMPEFPSRAWGEMLFGASSRHFSLEHLWFLWYLLVFVTAGPLVVLILSLPFRLVGADRLDQLGQTLIRLNAVGIVFGIVSLPLLLHAKGFMGWSLANPHGFMGGFPDFLVQYYPDQPFYFLYFVAGWWLYRLNSGFPKLAGYWLWNLTLGVAAFAVSRHLSNTWSVRPDAAGYAWIRVVAFALYGIGSACSTCGFIGFFLRFLDHPTRIGRYFADTALWIYLIHLPLIPYLIWWAQPSSGPWWTGSLAGMVVVTGVSLVLFELLIRPTPLNHLYGPPVTKRKTTSSTA